MVSAISIYASVVVVLLSFLYFTRNEFLSDSRLYSTVLLCIGGIALISAFSTMRQVLNLTKDFRSDDSDYKEKKAELLRIQEKLISSKL